MAQEWWAVDTWTQQTHISYVSNQVLDSGFWVLHVSSTNGTIQLHELMTHSGPLCLMTELWLEQPIKLSLEHLAHSKYIHVMNSKEPLKWETGLVKLIWCIQCRNAALEVREVAWSYRQAAALLPTCDSEDVLVKSGASWNFNMYWNTGVVAINPNQSCS